MLLDQAARSGLPVPTGGILLDDFYRICLAEGVIELAGDAVLVPDSVWLHEVLFRDIRFPRLAKAVAVRPAMALAAGENGKTGCAQLNIKLNDANQVADAFRTVWSTMNRDNDEQAHDLIIMEMVAIQTAGAARTAVDSEKDQIHLTTETGIELPGNLSLEKIGIFHRASADVPLYAQRLQKLLRGVRRSLGKGEWRLDWADDGEICWLLQIY